MAQKLDANLNVIQETPIDIKLIDGDLSIISKLDDEPNDVGGLTSSELKAKFDEAGNTIKDYLNNSLVPAILAADATEATRSAAEAERVSNEIERVSNETERIANEVARVSAETARESKETGYVARAEAAAKAAEEAAEYVKEVDAELEEAKKLSADALYAAGEAQSAATKAVQFAGAADDDRKAAASAAQAAGLAAELASSAVYQYPRIGANNTWETYDVRNEKFVDTHVSAEGRKGDDGHSVTMYVVSESTSSGGETRLQFNDKNGAKSIVVRNGYDGRSIYYSSAELEKWVSGTLKTISIDTISPSGKQLLKGDLVVTANGLLLEIATVKSTEISVSFLSVVFQDGLSVYYSTWNLNATPKIGDDYSIDTDTISLDGRKIRVGEFIIAENGFLFRVTNALAETYVVAKCLLKLVPVKGVDYFTEADKEEIVNQISVTASNKAGLAVAGRDFSVDGETITAQAGAEVFNLDSNGNITNAAIGLYSHAEGYSTLARDTCAHSEGYGTSALSANSHAEGSNSVAGGLSSHAEGLETTTSANSAHAEGESTNASGQAAHAEGSQTHAKERASHAEGASSVANGYGAHAEGVGTIANGYAAHTQGKYNIEDTSLPYKYAHMVGNGRLDDDRSNAHTLDWDGNAWFAGNVYVGSTSGKNKDSGSKKLATEEYVNSVAGGGNVDLTDYPKKDELKTINGESIVGSGNIEIKGGGASSWNDLTDRPFYEEANGTIHPIDGKYLPNGTPWVGEGTVYLDECEAAPYANPTLGKAWLIGKGLNLVVGNTYKITYNGVSYNCVCQRDPGLSDDEAAVAMGNFAVIGGQNTGEPFAMLIAPNYQRIDIIDLTGAASVKVGIFSTDFTRKRLDIACTAENTPSVINVIAFPDGTGEATINMTFDEIRGYGCNTNNIVRAFVVANGTTGQTYILPLTSCGAVGALFSAFLIEDTTKVYFSLTVKPDGSAVFSRVF